MKSIEQKKAASDFFKRWKKNIQKKTENEITIQFWEDLLQHVYGVEYPSVFIDFEKRVRVPGEPKPKRIDGYIASTRVLIEQKSRGVNLDRKIEQSGGILLTPYEQAKRYADNLKNTERPNWIVVCNFEEFRIHNLNSERADEYQSVFLEDLPKEYHRLAFLQDITNTHIYKEVDVSRKAGKLIGEIYTELQKQYEILDERAMHELNVLCVRLVFCLFAEDAGIFTKNQFGNYLRPYSSKELQYKLHDLFTALGTANRDNLFIDPRAKEFDYVNGGLFQDTTIGIPPISEDVKLLLVEKSSDNFNWENISPTIFGGIFEDTLNPETRHEGGMHYTSVENIHKVIDPLFLDDLRKELESILKTSTARMRKQKLQEFQEKLASIVCLDPACGSGNFLTETYISLRRLENIAIREYYRDMPALMGEVLNPIHVNIGQFYGIEINDFAVSVAKTAMWIAEYQMRIETYNIVQFNDKFLPLKSYANICHGNALQTEWSDIVKPQKLSYIMGNPPFVGKKEQTPEQKRDVKAVAGAKFKKAGVLDYVSAWYLKAINYMQGTNVSAAFVSTNSIAQGEQVPVLWKEMIRKGAVIDFAHQTFVWENETEESAAVNCVIIGFSQNGRKRKKLLFSGEDYREVDNINGYLINMDNVIIDANTSSISNAPSCCYGSMQIGNNHLSITEEEIVKLPKKLQDRFVRKYIGGDELINNTSNWCLWLKDASPKDLRKTPLIAEKVGNMRQYRLSSSRAQTNKLADTPHLFGEIRQPDERMLVIPKVSSERREYIPMDFVEPNVIISGSALIVAGASEFDFGVLTSSVHMAWMRTIGGRLEMRYQYSTSIVYNNFPWPEVTEKQREEITVLAQAVLEARSEWPNCSLADLYDPDTMPSVLRKAHNKLDRAVLKLYNLNPDADEMDILKHLLGLYKEIIKKNK